MRSKDDMEGFHIYVGRSQSRKSRYQNQVKDEKEVTVVFVEFIRNTKNAPMGTETGMWCCHDQSPRDTSGLQIPCVITRQDECSSTSHLEMWEGHEG